MSPVDELRLSMNSSEATVHARLVAFMEGVIMIRAAPCLTCARGECSKCIRVSLESNDVQHLCCSEGLDATPTLHWTSIDRNS